MGRTMFTNVPEPPHSKSSFRAYTGVSILGVHMDDTLRVALSSFLITAGIIVAALSLSGRDEAAPQTWASVFQPKTESAEQATNPKPANAVDPAKAVAVGAGAVAAAVASRPSMVAAAPVEKAPAPQPLERPAPTRAVPSDRLADPTRVAPAEKQAAPRKRATRTRRVRQPRYGWRPPQIRIPWIGRVL